MEAGHCSGGVSDRIRRSEIVAVVLLANIVCQVIRKPSELIFFVGGVLDKVPTETWQQYGPLFRKYSTDTITPELLAALAQIESTGNPVARTYWRWRVTWNPFGMYEPASSAVGLYQMTDAAYAAASRYCVRRHASSTCVACRRDNCRLQVGTSSLHLSLSVLSLLHADIVSARKRKVGQRRAPSTKPPVSEGRKWR
jgi:hypothetical protein